MATNPLDAILAQYEQSQKSGSNTNKMSQDERMKKYFAALLKDNEKQGHKRLRILPTTDGSSPFKEVWFHEIQVDGKWQKFYDPGKNEYVLTPDEVESYSPSDIKRSFRNFGEDEMTPEDDMSKFKKIY